ncbi:MAG TPA: cation transporter [Candidatus Limnocylindria bacterium]|nr:cation transporter [Candidatus Limnocylindria bacterium]
MSDTVMSDVGVARPALLRYALRLEYLTVGWNIVEGVVAIAAALAAGSVALLGFGLDSFVESASGAVLIWRLWAERDGADHDRIEWLERRALRLVGLSLFLLAAFVAIKAILSLAGQERPEASPVGIAVTSLSIGVMWWLARTKLRTARSLGSRSLEADSFQTTACWWLSLIVLGGIGMNALFGWWWADPVAAVGMTFFLVREGREAWAGEECGEA